MQKQLILIGCLVLSVILNARDNPFSSVINDKNIGKAVTIKDTIENFSQIKTNLPNTARILKKVELTYQNLDGSIENKKIKINKKIDWHNQILLKTLRNINIQYSETRIKIAEPILEKNKKIIKFKDIIKFAINKKQIHITTNDKKIRDFIVVSPYKIVIDFKKDLSFYTKSFSLNTKRFKKITIGNHNKYYRVVIKLDGQYKYSIQKINSGYIIALI